MLSTLRIIYKDGTDLVIHNCTRDELMRHLESKGFLDSVSKMIIIHQKG